MTGETSYQQLPWAAIPKFIPGTTDVTEVLKEARVFGGNVAEGEPFLAGTPGWHCFVKVALSRR